MTPTALVSLSLFLLPSFLRSVCPRIVFTLVPSPFLSFHFFSPPPQFLPFLLFPLPFPTSISSLPFSPLPNLPKVFYFSSSIPSLVRYLAPPLSYPHPQPLTPPPTPPRSSPQASHSLDIDTIKIK